MFSQDVDYMPELDSDECRGSDSSEDEMDVAVRENRLPSRLTTSSRLTTAESSNSAQDAFEKDMDAELAAAIKEYESQLRSADTCDGANASNGAEGAGEASASTSGEAQEPKFYENDYFDSDSDEEGTSAEKRSRRHPIPSNDDLLYDPDADEADQRWVDRQRNRQRGKTQKKGTKKVAPKSDAILDCPACMTTLCIDCQRHEQYQNQYRAMFVMHCKIDKGQILRFPENVPKPTKSKKKKKARFADAENDGSLACDGPKVGKESFNPVYCEECNTEVGVYDCEEVYHFYNIIAAYS